MDEEGSVEDGVEDGVEESVGSVEDTVWYRLGYTLESARERLPAPERLRSLAERRPTRKVGAPPPPRPEPDFLDRSSPTGEPWDAVLAAAATALAGRLLDALPSKRKPGPLRLLRAGAAGAGAALVRELVGPALGGGPRRGSLAEGAREAALAGAARGLLYGALLDPRIPGPPLLRGAAYGWLEYLVSPWGGLTTLAGPRAPHRGLPFLDELFEDYGPGEDTLMDHIVFGVTLATLYGASGAGDDRDDD